VSVEALVRTESSIHLTSDLVSTARGVHALNGLTLLNRGSGGGLEKSSQSCDLIQDRVSHPSHTLLLRSTEESSPTPWTWLPALVSTELSDDPSPLRGMFDDVEWLFEVVLVIDLVVV